MSTRTTRSSAKTTTTVAPAVSPPAKTKGADLVEPPAKKTRKTQATTVADTKTTVVTSVLPADTPAKVEPPKESAKQSAKEPAKTEELKKIVMKGKVPVDEIFSKLNSTDVHVLTADGVTYSTTMNQSNVSANNNKFYIIQVLQSISNPSNFYFWSRWGRVGVPGQNMCIGPTTQITAIREYQRKLHAKSVGGDYRIVEMNYDAADNDEKKAEKESAKDPKDVAAQEKNTYETSSLPKSVKDLIRLIFDMKMVDTQMRQIGYDSKKMPLGKLAKSSILKGYEALKNLMDEIKGRKDRSRIAQYSNDFYSNIPHDFGFANMANFILDSEQKIKQKLEMLQSLEDIQVFTKMLDEGKVASDVNELDSNYLKLNANITPIDKNSDIYKMLVKYVKNTHATTHNNYHLEVEQIFEMAKDQQEKRYTKHIHNKMLLWHGSRLTNFVGIISQGLRIAPPEAPVTGYMFGKGVYFADMVSKSANYCFTNKVNNTGLMLLCEVALGDMNEKLQADYYANLLPPGKMSTKGVGKTAPSSTETLGEVIVPSGPGTYTGVAGSSLLYNEFIVYDIAQIKMKYLFRMKFVYK